MKSIWTVLNVLLFFSFTSFNSASRTSSSLLAAASTSSDSSSNSSSSHPENSSSNSSCSSSSSSSSDSDNVPYRPQYDPHFYFLVEPKLLDKLKKNFENLPQNFHIVVRHKKASKYANRKRIFKFQEKFNRNVAILLSSSRVDRLKYAVGPAERSKLLKYVRKYFSEVIFPKYYTPSPELSLYLEYQEIANIKISEYFGKFRFKKWKAGMKSFEFEGNILFKWNYSSTKKIERIERFLAKMKVKKTTSPKKAVAIVEKPKGRVLNDLLRPGLWTLIYSKIEHKDLVRVFFNNHAAYLINLNETNCDTDDRLILKLEISDYIDLSTSDNIQDIINGYKIRFEQNTLQKLEYVLLTWDQSDLIKRAFLDCGVHVIHPNFTIEHGLNFDFRNFEGFGLVDLLFDAGDLIRTIDEHLDRQDLMSNFISMNDIVASKFRQPIFSSETEAQRRNSFYRMYARDKILTVSVERTNLFQSSLKTASWNNWRHFIDKTFYVKFLGEEGIDYGGLTREWFTEIFKIIFEPSFGLFKVSESNQNVFYPNELASEIYSNYLEYFKFAGLMVGVVLTYPFPIGFQFAAFFLKILLEKPMKLHDLKDVDEGLHQFLCWLLDNSVSQLEDTFYFVYEFDYYGEHRSVDLKEGGSNIPLTDENKIEYIFLVLRYVLVTKIRPHIDAFLSGFNLNISMNIIKRFNVGELGRLISGKSDIDIDDWERNTTYGQGFDSNSVQIVWFWRFMRTLDQPSLRKILQFSTGSTTVPIEGFAALKGQNGVLKRFQISPSSNNNRLPGFKTCYIMIIMPKYDSYQDLVYKFMMALNEGAGIFTFG